MRIPLLLTLCMIGVNCMNAQAPSSRETFRKDSTLGVQEYPYVLPILGDRVARKGFTLPLPHGVMMNFLGGQQKLELTNFRLGFNDSPLVNMDSILQFSNVSANIATPNVRLDTWILPFLNVSLIGGYTRATTNVDFALVNPVTDEPILELEGEGNSHGGYFGVGSMIAAGFGPLFFSGDFTYSWAFSNLLDKPAKLFITGLRAGPIIRMKNKPEMNVTFWTGVMYSSFNSRTQGEIGLTDALPGIGGNVDVLIDGLDNWYNGLPPLLQNKFEDRYQAIRSGLLDAKEGLDNATVRYEFDKGLRKPANLLVGGQWQINYIWQLRAEAQLLGDRTAGLISLNYRFGINGRNLFGVKG